MAMNCVDDVDTILGKTSLQISDFGMMGFGSSEKLRMINQLRGELDGLKTEVIHIRQMIPEIERGLESEKTESRSFAMRKAHETIDAMRTELKKLRTEIFLPSTLLSNTLLQVPLELQLQKMVRELSHRNRERFVTLLDNSLSKLTHSVNEMDHELDRLNIEQKRQAKAILELYELVGQVNRRVPA